MSNLKKNYYKKDTEKPNRKSIKTGKNYNKNYHNRPSRYSNFEKIVKSRREETVEDIQGDIERLEKEIEFEIKQIQSTKLGL